MLSELSLVFSFCPEAVKCVNLVLPISIQQTTSKLGHQSYLHFCTTMVAFLQVWLFAMLLYNVSLFINNVHQKLLVLFNLRWIKQI